jgi:hypothetical protein
MARFTFSAAASISARILSLYAAKNLRGRLTSELAGLDAVVTLSILSSAHALYSRNHLERPAINNLAQRRWTGFAFDVACIYRIPKDNVVTEGPSYEVPLKEDFATIVQGESKLLLT